MLEPSAKKALQTDVRDAWAATIWASGSSSDELEEDDEAEGGIANAKALDTLVGSETKLKALQWESVHMPTWSLSFRELVLDRPVL